MANSTTIRVGVFGSSDPNAIPDGWGGRTIWYSTKHKFFIITDENNVNCGEFKFDRYKVFAERDYILFSTPGTQAHMERLLREWEAEQAMSDPFNSFEALDNLAKTDSSYVNQTYNPHAPVAMAAEEDVPAQQPFRRSQRTQGVSNSDLLGENAAALQKDPTRHLPVFMVLTLVFTIIICIAINFGQPIIKAIAPLLS